MEKENKKEPETFEDWQIMKELRELLLEQEVKRVGKIFWIGLAVLILVMFIKCRNQGQTS
jgi:hypothetical protein